MSATYVGGTRLDHVRRCGKCGRKPTIRTGYDGYEGEGPFIILCDHGTPLKDQPDNRMDLALSRSWYKSHAIANWRSLWTQDHRP